MNQFHIFDKGLGSHRPLRVYSCTPVSFIGDESYFSRESGMHSRGLAKLGIESRAVMANPAYPVDFPELLRTDYNNLESAEWWRRLNLDGVILYSWAAPRFNRVAEALFHAGIPFLVQMDTCGLVSRESNPTEWFRSSWTRPLYERSWMQGKSIDLLKHLLDGILSITARRRVLHCCHAAAVTVPTPLGTLWVRREAETLGSKELAGKIHYLPHPQDERFSYSGVKKELLVVSIARWGRESWSQKNPQVLIEAYRLFLHKHPNWRGVIIGSGATSLIKELGVSPMDGLSFLDPVNHDELADILNRASITFWSSRWEGQQGTAAQALCCGCSVVSHGDPLMSCFRHYVSKSSGRLATRNHAQALADELELEAEAWDDGLRDPLHISSSWMTEFHATSVAKRSLGLMGLIKEPQEK